MKKGYIPKNQRKTILMLSDDIRTFSGVGNMAREIIVNTAHRYNWINLGGAVNHPDHGKGFDLSQDVNTQAGLTDSNVKVIAAKNYGSADMLRHIITQEKPDWAIKYVPHGIDEKKFYPIINDLEFEVWKENFLEKEKYDFIVLWNSRNIRRKNPSDIILSWRTFLDQLPKEQAKKCLLIMHTDPIDGNGTDLPAVVEAFCNPEIHKVKFDGVKWNEKELNYLYNISDCHMFMTDNEGWGLGLTESLTAGKMIIAPVQGGMQDQMRFEDENGDWINFTTEYPTNVSGKYKKCGDWAIPIFPKTRSVKGSPQTPYIFASQCSIEDATMALMKVYKMGSKERTKRGLKGREWVLSEESGFTSKVMGQRFIDNIDNLLKKWKPQSRFNLIKVDDSTLHNNYNNLPISLTPEFIKEIQSI